MNNSKTELEKRLFGPKGKNFKPLTKAQVEKFLRLSAEEREEFYHYTDISALIGILSGRALRLTRGSDLNDVREFENCPEKAKRTFVASFCRTIRENVAMWWLYGFHGKQTRTRIPVRIRFSGQALRDAVKGRLQAKTVRKKQLVGVKEPVWCDVIYQYSKGERHGREVEPAQSSIILDKKIADGSRCKAFMDALGRFPAYAKDGCWAHEEETRLTIELEKKEDAEGVRQISIPIAGALTDIEVCIGPGELAKKYHELVEKRLKKAGFKISGMKRKGNRVAVRTVKGKDDHDQEFTYTQRVQLVYSQCAVRFAGFAGKKRGRKKGKKARRACGDKASEGRAARRPPCKTRTGNELRERE